MRDPRSPAGEMGHVASPEMAASLPGEPGESQLGELGEKQSGEQEHSGERVRPPSAEERSGPAGEVTGNAINQRSQSQSSNSGEIFSEKLRDPPTYRRRTDGGSRSGCTTPIDAETGDSGTFIRVNEKGAENATDDTGDVEKNEGQDERHVNPQQGHPPNPRQNGTHHSHEHQLPHQSKSRQSDAHHHLCPDQASVRPSSDPSYRGSPDLRASGP